VQVGHKQEVCGLRWAHDGSQLASGGNDNKLFIWCTPRTSRPLPPRPPSPPLASSRPPSRSPHGTSPLLRFSDHTAAVKALAWSPHQNGLLASGGGTADRCIRFWNTQTATALSALDTGSQAHTQPARLGGCTSRPHLGGCTSAAAPRRLHLSALRFSQVCNLCWSCTVNELVSSHGYSQNQIVVWRYSSMAKVATLSGHTMRAPLSAPARHTAQRGPALDARGLRAGVCSTSLSLPTGRQSSLAPAATRALLRVKASPLHGASA